MNHSVSIGLKMTGASILSALLAIILGSYEGAAHNVTKDTLRSLPCPDPMDIYPCVCTADEDHNMDMDCSLVESEDQLARIFSSNIPFTKFRRLVIMNNRHLKALQSEDLGVASFETIFIQGGILEEVLAQALSNSFSSATYIDLQDNRVSEFPFQELPLFSSLRSLKLSMNWLSDFPALQSSVLQHIELDKNSFNRIPADGFTFLTNVETISFSNNHLQMIMPGKIYVDQCFDGNDNIAIIKTGRHVAIMIAITMVTIIIIYIIKMHIIPFVVIIISGANIIIVAIIIILIIAFITIVIIIVLIYFILLLITITIALLLLLYNFHYQ